MTMTRPHNESQSRENEAQEAAKQYPKNWGQSVSVICLARQFSPNPHQENITTRDLIFNDHMMVRFLGPPAILILEQPNHNLILSHTMKTSASVFFFFFCFCFSYLHQSCHHPRWNRGSPHCIIWRLRGNLFYHHLYYLET